MKNIVKILPVIIGLLVITTFTNSVDYTSIEETAVEQTVLKAYIHGAFNELNPDAMAEGFHPDFAIFSANGEEINKYPIAKWVEGVRKRKSKEDFDPANNKWDHNFTNVDVTGGSAQVKVELSHKGTHVYTDYLSLLKFDSGWKIVAKVYHKHTAS